MSAPVIHPAARKHGVADHDMLHALRNAIKIVSQDDGMTMHIGPDTAGNLIEVGTIDSTGGPVVLHALRPARRKYLPPR